mmetsp:Transcript_10456/g.22668  ORF Transcript_10456/g.22668 Transcript_10456/m.22668 type:complete len:285 (-) Transcript_10456:1321-2175(-)
MANSRSPSHDESLPLRPLFLAFFELTLFESVVEIQTMLRRTPLRSCGANAQKLSMSSYFSVCSQEVGDDYRSVKLCTCSWTKTDNKGQHCKGPARSIQSHTEDARSRGAEAPQHSGCVRDSVAMAFLASLLVTNSQNANPRCVPSNFFGRRTFFSWPNEPKSWRSSVRVASKGTLRTMILVFLEESSALALAGALDDDERLFVESLISNAWPSTSFPCIDFVAFSASSSDWNSANPNPMDRDLVSLSLGSAADADPLRFFTGAAFVGILTARGWKPAFANAFFN